MLIPCDEVNILNTFRVMIILRPLLLLTNLHLKLLSTQGTGADKLLSTQRVKLNKSKSTGPDLIHPWVLSETAGSICIPLAMNAYDLHKVYGTRYHAFKLETGSCECNL